MITIYTDTSLPEYQVMYLPYFWNPKVSACKKLYNKKKMLSSKRLKHLKFHRKLQKGERLRSVEPITPFYIFYIFHNDGIYVKTLHTD